MDTILSCVHFGKLFFLKNICPPTHFSFFSNLSWQIDESRIYHVSVIFFDTHILWCFFNVFFVQMRISMACLPTALDYLLTQLHWMILWRKMVWHVLLVFSNLGISDSLLVERSLLPKLRRPASSLGEFLLGSELNWFRSELIFAASAAEIQGRGRQHLERIFGAAFWPHVAQRGLWVFGSENQHFERFTSLR